MKPILKWVGGKTQIITEVTNTFPNKMENYHEPFLGGGSVLFRLLELIQQNKIEVNGIYASDLNEALIGVYKNIQNKHLELYNEIKRILEEPVTEQVYYSLRTQYNSTENKLSLTASALFIILNKTCFRGLYRIGPRGFNVPYGNYKNPEIINFEHLGQVHELIQDVNFVCCDFTESLKKVKPNDFVYLDPPYVPVNATSFVGYTSGGFNKHQELFDTLKTADYSFVMSNSDSQMVTNQFKNTKTILAKRSINSKNPESKVKELLILK